MMAKVTKFLEGYEFYFSQFVSYSVVSINKKNNAVIHRQENLNIYRCFSVVLYFFGIALYSISVIFCNLRVLFSRVKQLYHG